jgi:hypothetical protein
MMAPEDFVTEEERLREEREAAYAAEAAEVRRVVQGLGTRCWLPAASQTAPDSPYGLSLPVLTLCRPLLLICHVIRPWQRNMHHTPSASTS